MEINVYDNMVPLVSGYLQAYASTDPRLRQATRFRKYTASRKARVEDVLSELTSDDTELFAFSCYLWNMGLIKKLLPPLLEMKPEARILLGGPQVMYHAQDYIEPSNERVFVCNGEGERTFANFLRELATESPDFTNVRGLSFYRDGELITTKDEERIQDLNEIPSPFLTGVFEGQYQTSVIETNRGCPFRCAFCFWGAATNDRVFKFDDDRVRAEVEWLSRHENMFLIIADANWGMQKRDIDISRQIAACNKQYAYPIYVYFSAAKNSPGRVAEITELFTKAGLFSTQPISMQSLAETTLEQIDRKNIKLTAFEELQKDLNAKEISSFIELIWPLPGETLSSFKDGIEVLCERSASTVIVYPHILLHNTPLFDKRDEQGLETRSAQDEVAEAEIVIKTADVTTAEFEEGMRFIYAVNSLYNARSLPTLGRYLHTSGKMSYGTLLSRFAEFCESSGENFFSRFCRKSITDAEYYDIVNYPKLYHAVLHGDREEFDQLLHAFASTQAWWNDERAQVLFEIDLLRRPYLYSNTAITTPTFPLQHVRIADASDRSLVLEVPGGYLDAFGSPVGGNGFTRENGHYLLRLNHKRAQYPFNSGQSREHNADYCNGMIMRVGDILPTCEPVTT